MSQPWPVGLGQLGSTPESEPASLSPRTSLLSPPPFEDDDLPNSQRRARRGPSIKFRHERERAHSTVSQRELMQMLVNEEYESKQMRKILYTAFERLEHETKRADSAEARIEETIQRAKAINDARFAAQQQAVRAQEELKLYKLQLDNAQKEILRAQDVLQAIEAQRDEAEAAAVSARSKARRLNEERLIELAREEGRRLGFEEGVRRGRRMGFREAHVVAVEDHEEEVREVATAVVDRLLEAGDEPEQIEVMDPPTPIPPPSSNRSAPEVHRLETPVNSSPENQRHSFRNRRGSPDSGSRSTLRRAPDPPPPILEPRNGTPSNQSSRPHSASQPWAGPPSTEPFFNSRPSSIQDSPTSAHHSHIHIPPDNYIPSADSNHNISLPPPHELHRLPSPTPSQQTLGASSERGRNRDYMYDNYPPPRRGSPDHESLASTKQSATSTISQLDIVGLPTSSRNRDRSQNLSIIHEDASVRSDRMTDYSQATPQTGRHSFQEMRSNETLRRDRKSNQRLADELRYSDPSEAEQWRQQSESSRSRPQDGPSRHRPAQIVVPTPLSPPRVLQQPDSRHRRTTSERQGRSETRSNHRDQRRPLSSDSSVPEINIEPPSGPPSDAPSRGRGNIPSSGLLSPDHANLPLPVSGHSSGSSSGGHGHNGPVIPDFAHGGSSYSVPQDGQLSPGYIPPPVAGGSSQAPVIPKNGGGSSQRPASPYGPPSSERETRGQSRTPISFYAASPVPAGVTYPAPPVPRRKSRTAAYNTSPYPQGVPSNPAPQSRSAAYNTNPYPQGVPSNPSVTSLDGRRRQDSLSTSAAAAIAAGISSSGRSTTPTSRARPPVQMTSSSATDGSGGGGRDSGMSRRQSNASLGTGSRYSRYNPSVYNDPAYLASSGSLVEPSTDPNGGETIRPVRIRGGGSPAYSYATLRTNE